MENLITQLAESHHYFTYFVILLASIVEGPIISMILGVMIKAGIVGFWPSYIVLMLGDIIADICWYWVGRRYGHKFINRFGKYVGVDEIKVEKLTHIFHKHKHSILFISKISNGFGFSLVTLITAGMVKIPFYKYFAVNFMGQLVWSGVLIGVGYYFSQWYIQIDSWMGKVGLIAVGLVLVWVFVQYTKYVRKQVIKD